MKLAAECDVKGQESSEASRETGKQRAKGGVPVAQAGPTRPLGPTGPTEFHDAGIWSESSSRDYLMLEWPRIQIQVDEARYQSKLRTGLRCLESSSSLEKTNLIMDLRLALLLSLGVAMMSYE